MADAAIHSYAVAYWWGAAFFAFGAVLAALLFRRRGDGLSLATPRDVEPEAARAEEPEVANAEAPEATRAEDAEEKATAAV